MIRQKYIESSPPSFFIESEGNLISYLSLLLFVKVLMLYVGFKIPSYIMYFILTWMIEASKHLQDSEL